MSPIRVRRVRNKIPVESNRNAGARMTRVNRR